jgi:hypothetical protein
MPRTRRAAWTLAAAALLGACDNSETPFPTQSAGGSGGGGSTSFSVSDPSDDQRGDVGEGAPDAITMSGSVQADTLVVRLAFRNAISPWSANRPNSLTGFVDLDLDQSAATGIPSAIDEAGGDARQGVEFYVSLEDVDGDYVALVDVETQDAYRVPASFTATGVTVRIPRALLSDAAPGFTISALVGHGANEAADFVPNTGHVVVR